MNQWLDKVLEWGQQAIDEEILEFDAEGHRAMLYGAVTESLSAKEYGGTLKVVLSSDYQGRLPTLLVPLSGGLDSLVVWERALESGQECRAYYVKFQTPYAEAELEALKKLEVEFSVIDLSSWPQRWRPYATNWKHILPLRNMAIILALAEEYGDRPAEIQLGATEGEIPPRGGDKSIRFFDAMDTVLESYPIKHTLKFPLRHETKTDIVEWWINSDRPASRLMLTITCQQPRGNKPCGGCHACFNRWVAFTNNGLFEEMDVDPMTQLANAAKVEAMEKAMDERDWSAWSERRILQTLSAWQRGLEYRTNFAKEL